MEQTANRVTPEASTDERASPLHPQTPLNRPAGVDKPAPAEVPLLSDCLAETFPPGARKPRHDGWTPEAIAGFLRHLAASGIVEHAAEAVGLSASAAYAFRNRRQGRAFARMWDAILIHRARARLASEMQGRAIAGCVSVRKRDGVVVGEYHYYDNRLAAAVLSRLLLGQPIEARRPEETAQGGLADSAPEPDDDPELTHFARLAGCPHYRGVPPREIHVLDLDPTRQAEWEPDQFVRAFRSGFMDWLQLLAREEPGFVWHPGAALRFHVSRIASRAAAAAEGGAFEAEDVETADLDPAALLEWSEDQLARAWHSDLIERLPARFWDDLAGPGPAPGGGE